MLPWYLRFSWLIALISGIIGYFALLVIALLTENTTLIPAILLVGAATVPLSVLLFAQTDKYGELVSPHIALMTVLLGGMVGIGGAGLLESLAGVALGRGSILLVGIIEESMKLLVPLVVLAVSYKSTRLGGVVIGIASGTGFAILETMGYGFNALLTKGGGMESLNATLLLRAVLVPAGHVAWTGMVCAALWYLVSWRRPVLGFLGFVGAYVLAIVLHTLWDTVDFVPINVAIGVLSVAALVIATHLAHRAQKKALIAAQAPLYPPRTAVPHPSVPNAALQAPAVQDLAASDPELQSPDAQTPRHAPPDR